MALGFRLGDPIAGFVITVFIAHVGWEVTHDVVHHLMDGVEVDHVEAARDGRRKMRASSRSRLSAGDGWGDPSDSSLSRTIPPG